MKEISEVDPEELVRILEIEKEKALEIIQRASEGSVKEGSEPTRRKFPAPSGPQGTPSIESKEWVKRRPKS